MKQILKTLMLLIAFSLTTVHGYAQNNIDINLLQGSWTFDYDTSLANIDAQSKKRVSKMKPAIKNMLKQSYRNRQLTFFKNGEYLQVFSNGKEQTGNWSDRGFVLEIKNNKGRGKRFRVVLLSDSKLVLRPLTKGKLKAVFTNWYLIKN